MPSTRGFDKPLYPLHDDASREIPTAEGLTRQAEDAASNMALNDEIEAKISDLVRKIFPDVNIRHKLRPQKQVQITSKDPFGEYNITGEGFGLNQLVYLFQQLVQSKRGASLFIEEPEISLHPAAQSTLCSVLIDIALNEQKQLFITTHSEHILLGFLEAAMEKKLQPTDLRIYYFEKINGITKVSRLNVTERGELEGGLKGFFEVDLEHITKFFESASKGTKSGPSA